MIAILAFGVTAAWAVIERLTPLAGLIKDADYIFVAKIEKVLPEKPGVILNITDDLKAKAPFRRLTVNLKGDNEKEPPQLLERLAADLPVLLIVTEVDKKLLMLAYTNGTWFQVVGQPDGDAFRWSFTHTEPFLRRTFKGTTAEMQQVIADAIAGKQKPPPVDAKEPPGLGPKVEKSE